jgi:hypothetical protein
MAIFWEESLFTNVKQSNGTAIGFGQVEPAELGKLTTQKAKDFGYYVDGVSTKTKSMTDEMSVLVPSCYLLHLFHSSSADTKEQRVDFALKAYAGYFYEGPNDPLGKERRLQIIGGWRACEGALRALPFDVESSRDAATPQLEDAYMKALALARPFQVPALRDRLFPDGWYEQQKDQTPSVPVFVVPGIVLAAFGLGGAAMAEILYPGSIKSAVTMASRLAASTYRSVRGTIVR